MRTLIYIYVLIFCASCAQITPLTGGKKDDAPPKPISFKPENASLNFTSKSIEISFDEYIALKDLNNQFIITPQLKTIPDVQVQGKKLKISFSESLMPNTTYKLAFGNAIVDLNESNVLQNFEYILSTGSSIDSLSIKGTIIDATERVPRSNILVGLYPANSNDSIIYKEKPLYIHKTNDYGNFKFTYLPQNSFKLIAINDKNKNLSYDGAEEEIAFINENTSANDTSLQKLTLFKEIPSKRFIKRSYLSEPGKFLIIYNAPREDIINVTATNIVMHELNKGKDTLSVYFDGKIDTLKTIINYRETKSDTLQLKITSAKSQRGNSTEQLSKYSVQTNITGTLPFYEVPKIYLNYPIYYKNINASKIILQEKHDTNNVDVPISIVCDTGLIRTLALQAKLKPETNYKLSVFSKAFLKDDGRTNDTSVVKFTTTIIDDYGLLNLKLLLPKKENYIVQLLNDKAVMIEERIVEVALSETSEKLLTYKNLLPGLYKVKVIEDINKNGRYDTGDYIQHKQPEGVFINNTLIKLMAGWEIEHEWIVR